ncbi:hypothetical protein PACTADRAFT_35159 [Pachysolen tannophilus NRRL Y-2460]|uniref:Mitochondrial 15S rRNA processing factor CCM1 n=1 Tax=Pachysolen tannophilus NRRL Y-2460 TaxID=669874 RepID=A0A1E4TRJ8_PACTA|nr:hypothetical protein PACTADRAFT_35159 [Pachysolen tannophilus NRRL Y-2460]
MSYLNVGHNQNLFRILNSGNRLRAVNLILARNIVNVRRKYNSSYKKRPASLFLEKEVSEIHDEKPQPRETAASIWLKRERERKAKQEEAELGRKLKELENLKERLTKEILQQNELTKRKQIEKELDIISSDDRFLEDDVDNLVNDLLLDENKKEERNEKFLLEAQGILSLKEKKKTNEIMSEEKKKSLFSGLKTTEKQIFLPEKVIKRIGDSISHVNTVEFEDWESVIKDLYYNKNGFKGFDQFEVTRLIQNIPNRQKPKNMELIDEMLFQANIEKDRYLYDLFISSYSNDAKYGLLVDSFFQEMKQHNFQPTVYTFGNLIKSFGKRNDIKSINKMLQEMKLVYKIAPTLKIYTNILQICVKLNDYKEAVEIFDTMKFQSLSTQPDSKAYQSIVIAHVLNDNIEKALDLYDEMVTNHPKPLIPTGLTLLVLAKGCAKREELLLKGWEFIFEYHEKNHPLNSQVIESMMYLAAYDGDLTFTRALYNTLFEARWDSENKKLSNPGSTPLTLLFVAYARFKVDRDPVTLRHPQIQLLRKRTINSTNYNFDSNAPPFLPMEEIKNDKAILAESNAIWAYNLMKSPDVINKRVIGSFLFISARKGESISEFKKRFENVTYLDETGLQKEEGKHVIIENEEEIYNTSTFEELKEQPPAIRIGNSISLKFPRTHDIYNLAIDAAKFFKDIEFANKIWVERGKFRNTLNYKSLSADEKYAKDFEFAQYIISTFAELGLLEDARKIILSTKSSFNWKWLHLRSTFVAAEKLGDETCKETIREVLQENSYKLKRNAGAYYHPKSAS